jgi:drug/metabolite transporter (DMT)-like permease
MTKISSETPLSQKTGVLLILLGALSIGLMPSAAKIAYQEGANPLAAIILRSLIGFLGIGIYMVARKHKFNVGWREIRFSSLTGVAQSFTSLGIMGSVAFIDVNVAALIIFCFPFWVAIYNHFSGTSKLTPTIISCFTLALIGLALTLGMRLGELHTLGLVLALLGMFSMAIMVLMAAHSSANIGPITANFFMAGWTLLYFLLIAFAAPVLGLLEAASFPVSSKGWIAIIGTGVSFTLGYVLFFIGAAVIGTTRASILSISEPVMIIIVAVLLIDEWLTPIQWLGVMLVIGSLLALELPKKSIPAKIRPG